MNKTQLISEGNQQLIVLPENYHFQGKEVYLKKIGDNIVIISENPWQEFWQSLDQFSEDFMEVREELPLETREDF